MFNIFNKQKIRKVNDINSDVDILYITYNRLPYTKETLPILLNSAKNTNIKITIVDNNSNDGTIEYLNSLEHKNIREIIFNSKNQGLVKPTLKFWKNSNAKYVGKIDNDILVEKGWVEKLINAHEKVEDFGVIGCSHYRDDDYSIEKLQTKLSTVNGIVYRDQPWIGGNYIAKKSTFINNPGYHQSRRGLKKKILYGFTGYQKQLSNVGFINGYIATEENTLLHWTHLDDPREPQFLKDSTHLKIRNHTPEQIIEWYKRDAKQLLEDY